MNKKETQYWNNFYKDFKFLKESAFSQFVGNYFEKTNNLKILDLGCGNGRDSYYFSSKHFVLGIDKSNKPFNKHNCKFILGDMITVDKTDFDIIYSRFTFHSITDIQQEQLIKTIKSGTYLCIETRSDKGIDTYRVYGDNHYRNLTNINKLKNLLTKYDFEILYIEESDNFAIYKEENPICIRVICRKN